MKRAVPLDDRIDVISSDESYEDSETEINNGSDINMSTTDIIIDQPARDFMTEETLVRRAKMYQDYMKQIPIPSTRGSVVPFTSWMGLGSSLKQLYNQPLHYLTNILLKQWDQLRIGSDDEHLPLDSIIHPLKAEATIWLMEELHRKTSSHAHIAKLWMVDSMHHAFIDSIFPTLETPSL